ncbi:unnamed protein product [Oreochromis niloticus]|nr:unnamed protein product [Mustela putorius furo]
MMKVTTFSIRLFLVFMVIQADCSNFVGAVFPHIVPNRLQFFEYESVSVHCEVDNNITEWKVKWKSHKIKNASYTSTSPCIIYPSFESHSGEYWCETEDGIKSEALNITITAGSVILETPTHPVKEGNEVTLNCKNKKTQSKHITDFYKDGVSIGTSYQSSMMIKNVSKCDEGLYKCSIDGAGESHESWLAVLKQNQAPYNKTDLSHEVPKISQDEFPKTHLLLWTVICALLVDLLLLLVGLLLQNKCKVSPIFSSVQGSRSCEDNTVLQEEYTQVSYASVQKELKVSGEHIETVIYSSVN